LALEVASDGIRVNVVRPGFDLYRYATRDGGERLGQVDRIAQSALATGGQPEEVAEAHSLATQADKGQLHHGRLY